MHIKYLKGKRSKHGFTAVGEVYFQTETPRPWWSDGEIYYGTEYSLQPITESCCIFSDGGLHFNKRTNTLKAIIRKIKKQNYKKGTIIQIPSWYIGYANLIVVV